MTIEASDSGSIVFVHGTGVRLAGYRGVSKLVAKTSSVCGLKHAIIPCAWGDPLGIEFEGKSLPDPPSVDQLNAVAKDASEWNWLLHDPLFELGLLTIRSDLSVTDRREAPDRQPKWKTLWKNICSYQPSDELRLLLARGSLDEYWRRAWDTITQSEVAKAAFKASNDELPEVSRALARSVVAELQVVATTQNAIGPNATLRAKIIDRLLTDWDQQVLGRSSFFVRLFQRIGTNYVRERRDVITKAVAFPMGDILLYQLHGETIRTFIRSKIEAAKPPVTLLGHSLGGVACVDLLALPHPPHVHSLVTFGSQASFFHEIGSLASLKPKGELPREFPRWLNVFDRNDFLSFYAQRVFPFASDFESNSGLPFPDAHSDYFSNETVWRRIKEFIREG